MDKNTIKKKNKRDIIGLCGFIGSGKSTRAKDYMNLAYEHICFADKVRSLAWKMLEWAPLNDEEYELFKITPLIAFYLFKDSKKGIIKKGVLFSILSFIFQNTPLGRHLLQKVGNDTREIVDENVWIMAIAKETVNIKKVVISDVRYLNEVGWVISQGGKIIFCDYRSNRYVASDHPSEYLASCLVKKGFKDGEDVTEYLKCLMK